MELYGKIIAVLPERSGVSARSGSEWRLASYVLETFDQYPRRMNFEVFGTDRIQQFNIQAGETMTVSFDIDAREFRRQDGTVSWFNSIRAWKVDRNAPAAAPSAAVDAANIPPFAAAPAPAAAPGAPFAAAPAPQAAPQQAAPDVNPFPPMQGDGTDDLPF